MPSWLQLFEDETLPVIPNMCSQEDTGVPCDGESNGPFEVVRGRCSLKGLIGARLSAAVIKPHMPFDAYCFTAPRARPLMMYLFANTVTMSGGTMITREFAAMSQ